MPGSALISYLLRRTGNVEVAVDLTGEVFAAALAAAPGLWIALLPLTAGGRLVRRFSV